MRPSIRITIPVGKQAPNWRQPTGDSQVVSLLGYGLAFRDRREDWPMVLGAANLRASVRSLSWMETLALFERLYGISPSAAHPARPQGGIDRRQRGPGETSLALVRLQANRDDRGSAGGQRGANRYDGFTARLEPDSNAGNSTRCLI